LINYNWASKSERIPHVKIVADQELGFVFVHDSDELLFVCFYGLMMGLWTGTIKSFTDIIQIAFGPTTNILVGGVWWGCFVGVSEDHGEVGCQGWEACPTNSHTR
jgi:hypothetical protein